MDSPGEELELEVEPPTFSSGSALVASFNKSFGGTSGLAASRSAGAQMESTRGRGHGTNLNAT